MQQLAGLQDVAGAGVGDGDDAGLRRQRLQPVGEPVLRVLPVFRRRLQPLVDHAAILLLRDQLAEGILALYRPAFTAGGGESVKREAVHPFFLQMKKGAFHQRGVVRGNIVDRRVLLWLMIRAADADDGHVDIGQQLFNFGIVIVGDNAIAQPLFDVFDACPKVLFNKDIPFQLGGLQILADTFNYLAVISFVGVK